MGNASGALERFTLYWAFFSLALFRWLEGPLHIPLRLGSGPALLSQQQPQLHCRPSRH